MNHVIGDLLPLAVGIAISPIPIIAATAAGYGPSGVIRPGGRQPAFCSVSRDAAGSADDKRDDGIDIVEAGRVQVFA
jgi:hypothetical protein